MCTLLGFATVTVRVVEAERDGAKLTELGRFTSAAAAGNGYFHLPRLVTQVNASSRIAGSC